MMEIPSVVAKSRSDFRRWLEKNHDKRSKVAVVLNKRHTGIPAPSHRELMEEAICFGWIDTTVRRVDDRRFIRHFSRRGPHSKWSDNTLSYARQLIRQGKMTPFGMKFYKEGLSRPTHDHGIPKNPDMPAALKSELRRNRIARENFDKFPPSAKRAFYRWILRAKMDETRSRRVKRTVVMAAENRRM